MSMLHRSPRRRGGRWAGQLLLWLGLALPLPAQPALGLGRMWTFDRPPLDYFEREYGFRPDAAWLQQVMLASLRLDNGCSASFVSPHGLILTNHHCVRQAITDAQGGDDWLSSGFVAADPAREVRLPGVSVRQLVRITDVSARMAEGVDAAMAPALAAERRRQNEQAILAAAARDEPQLQPQVVGLFAGARFQLYQYRVFDDVRLCVAPHLQIASFGGDPDNFVYPRFCIDFAFCRAWVDGAPADTAASYFRLQRDGAREGELVFVTGNPGRTKRLLTSGQLDYQRDGWYPRLRQLIDNRLRIMRRFAAEDPALHKRLRPIVLSYENGQKLFRGEHAALLDPQFAARKRAAEAAIQERIAARPELQARYGNLWRDLAAVAQKRLQLDAPLNFHTAGGSPQLLRALLLLEYAAEPSPAAAAKVRAVRCDGDALQQALFVDHLARAQQALPPADPFLAALLAGGSPAAAAARLQHDSRLADVGLLERLLAGGAAAIAACDDPALRVARVLAPLEAAHRQRDRMLDAEEQALAAELAHALFELYGDDISPDATGTLRLSDGRVRGYEYNGTVAPWRTVFHGLYARSAAFDGAPPFDLPQVWQQAEPRIDLRAAVDFVCTADSTGGNSGSPVIDRERRLVGLLFDGNIESLGNEFLFREGVERSVCVHPQAIVEALRVVYGADWLLRELLRD